MSSLAALKSLEQAAHAPNRPFTIFVKGLNWVGDAIISTPMLAHLRHSYPDARITLMVRPWVAPVYEHNPDIDELWVHDDSGSIKNFWSAVRRIRQAQFTLGLALPNSLRSAALMYFGGVRFRAGYERGGRSLLLNLGVPVEPKLLEVHQVYYYLGLIKPMCGQPASQMRLTLAAGELEREEVKRLLAQLGLDRGQPLVGLAPGSINSNAKRWPAERFAALAERLVKDDQSEVLLLGSAKEAEVLDRVAAQCKAPLHNLKGKINLGQMIALTERLAGLICNDSGAMHLGAAIGTPTVAIFGPTQWTTTYPFSTTAKIVRREGVECAPCMLRECPLDHRCMTRVEPEEVFDAFKQLVKVARQKAKKSNDKLTKMPTGEKA